MPKVDERVLDGVLTNLLSPSKLSEMLSRLRAQDTAKDAVRAEKLGGFQDAQQAAEDRLRRLYSAIEKGVVDLDDPTLRAIIAAAHRERDDAKAAVETLTRDHQPETPISPEKIATFVSEMRRILLEKPNEVRRGYLRKIVCAVEVDECVIRLYGDVRRLERAVLADEIVPQTMPTFVREWRRDRDSNPGSAHTDNGFRDRRIRPLCHLSASGVVVERAFSEARGSLQGTKRRQDHAAAQQGLGSSLGKRQTSH